MLNTVQMIHICADKKCVTEDFYQDDIGPRLLTLRVEVVSVCIRVGLAADWMSDNTHGC